MRLAFVVLTLAGGAGVVLYAGGWLFLPTQTELGHRARPVAATTWCRCVALGAVTLGVLLFARSLGLGFSNALLWPVVLAAMGTALIVGRSGRPIDELIGELVRRERGHGAGDDPTTRPRRRRSCASSLGGALVVAGVGAFLATQGAFRAVGQGLLAVAVILGGLGLIFGPWLWRLWNALVEERSERIRSDERAEMAAHLHDSVLQTLALIQRRADDPRRSSAWRGARSASCAPGCSAARRCGPTSTSATRSKRSPPTSRQRQGVPIETVRVGGTCPLDDRLRALVAASQEAIAQRGPPLRRADGRGLRRGRSRPGDRVRARPRARLRSRRGPHRPRRHRRVDHRAHAAQRRTSR